MVLGPEVTRDDLSNYVKTTYPSGKGGEGYRKNLVTFLKVFVGRPINSNLLLEIPSKNLEKQNYCTRRWEEIYSEDRLPFVNWKHPQGNEAGLSYGQWVLLSLTPISEEVGRGVNKKITSEVFARDKSTCTRCGAKSGEKHHLFPDKTVQLHVGHLIPFITEAPGKVYTADDFTTLCSMCNEGEKANTLTVDQKIRMLLKQKDSIEHQLLTLQGAS